MGREVRRVPLDFDWPLNKVWHGFLMPDELDEERCTECDGTGYSDHARTLQSLWYGYIPFDPATTGSTPWAADSPAIRRRAEHNVSSASQYYGTGEAAIRGEAQRLADLFNGQWSHHLHQDDVDALIAGGRLHDFTHRWTRGEGWQPIEPAPRVTAAQVNAWSLGGMGHDAINRLVAVRARCEREGVPDTCSVCGGHGSAEKYEGQRAEAEAWECVGPPAGDGWQLWETVSEGSPISPVFAAADGLATWMSDPARGRHWVPAHVAAKFIAGGWAPSMVATPETGVVSGVEFVGTQDAPS